MKRSEWTLLCVLQYDTAPIGANDDDLDFDLNLEADDNISFLLNADRGAVGPNDFDDRNQAIPSDPMDRGHGYFGNALPFDALDRRLEGHSDFDAMSPDDDYLTDGPLSATTTSSTDSGSECSERGHESLSSYFAAIECDFHCQHTLKMQFPLKFKDHLCALYAPSTRQHVVGMLHSARYGHFDDGQVAVIGTGGDELVRVLEGVFTDCPMDVIYTISDLVGHALVWLRAPGLNLVKWSAASMFATEQPLRTEDGVNVHSMHSLKGQNGRWQFNYQGVGGEEGMDAVVPLTVTLSVFGGGCGFSDDEFYFSGYGHGEMDEAMVDLLDGLSLDPPPYVDLDWCFAAFLLLGVVPEEEGDGRWRRYLNHKLLSALPGNCSLRTIMAS